MDRRKFRRIIFPLLCLLSFLLWPVCSGLRAQEEKDASEQPLEKPLVEFPQVDIIAGGQLSSAAQGAENLPVENDDRNLLKDIDGERDEYVKGLISVGGGRFNTFVTEVSHLARTKNFNYSLQFYGDESGGERLNSEYSTFYPQLILGIPLNEEDEISFKMDYFEKSLGMPGPTYALTPDNNRKNEDMRTALVFSHKDSESGMSLEPFYEYALLDDNQASPDYRYRAAGAKISFDNDSVDLSAESYQERLLENYQRIISDASLRFRPAEISDSWLFQSGADFYGQENFGVRASLFLELVFKPDPDFTHKVTFSRKFNPLSFKETYLNDDYTEVNPGQLRPERIAEISYDLDASISPEWRFNGMLYARDYKDYWFWSDNDGDGLYAPDFMDRISVKGIKFSTEYSWTDSFSNFFSLDLRKVKSWDDNYEFIPYIARQKISTGLTYKFTPKAKLDFVGEYFGRRYYTGNTKSTLRGYFIVSSKLTYTLKDFLTFYVLVDNLLNDHYEIVKGYPNQSRSAFSGIMVRF